MGCRGTLGVGARSAGCSDQLATTTRHCQRLVAPHFVENPKYNPPSMALAFGRRTMGPIPSAAHASEGETKRRSRQRPTAAGSGPGRYYWASLAVRGTTPPMPTHPRKNEFRKNVDEPTTSPVTHWLRHRLHTI